MSIKKSVVVKAESRSIEDFVVIKAVVFKVRLVSVHKQYVEGGKEPHDVVDGGGTGELQEREYKVGDCIGVIDRMDAGSERG